MNKKKRNITKEKIRDIIYESLYEYPLVRDNVYETTGITRFMKHSVDIFDEIINAKYIEFYKDKEAGMAYIHWMASSLIRMHILGLHNLVELTGYCKNNIEQINKTNETNKKA